MCHAKSQNKAGQLIQSKWYIKIRLEVFGLLHAENENKQSFYIFVEAHQQAI